ncbi:RAC serine/threonine-protein kinase [Enteropsectra breve]|nr:RAC serine/threonine-protein kinase [Enteropsectra breve]
MITKDDIICLRSTGRGPFYQEYLCTLDTNTHGIKKYKVRAMSKRKIVQCDADEKMVADELYVRTALRHPFLVNQICAFQDYNNLFYLTEFAPIPFLKSSLAAQKLTPEAIRFYGAEIFSCLRYLHGKGQVYAFLSPQNIYLSFDGHIKLEFAFCNGLCSSALALSHYIEFAPPEYIFSNRLSVAGDYWSFGVVLYFLQTGNLPYRNGSIEELAHSIRSDKITYPACMDPDLRNLLKKLLLVDESTRLGAKDDDANLVLNHAFFKNIEWKSLRHKKISPPYISKIKDKTDLRDCPRLSALYTSDFFFEKKDGYGEIFADYDSAKNSKV